MKYIHLISLATLLVLFNNVYAEETEVFMEYTETIKLDCSNISATDFYSIKKDGTETPITAGGKYTIANHILTITNLRKAELSVDYGCSNVDKTSTKIFRTKSEPYMYAQEKNSLTVSEGGNAQFECKLIVGLDNGQNVNWTWLFNDKEITPSEKYVITDVKENATLTVKDAKLTDKGMYTCLANNGYGNHTQTLQLRVKDALAALWPFLGIVAEVIVLSLIIIIYELKFNKKPSSEDETEQSSRLVDNKNDGDLKKRATK